MENKADWILLDPDFYKGKGTFTFPNGDKYEGEYYAHRSGVVWREGDGIYTTSDGHVYKGSWLDDKLDESSQVEVIYPNGAQYYGPIVDYKYEGSGTYIFENKICLLSEFNNNKPTGDMTLIDVKGRQWRAAAIATAGSDETLFLPEHIYFNSIEENFGQGKRKRQISKPKKTPSPTQSLRPSIQRMQTGKSKNRRRSTRSTRLVKVVKKAEKECYKEMEIKTFAKSKKTASDLRLDSSDWYKNYVNFKILYDNILNKIKNDGRQSLTKEENEWYAKYTIFKQKYYEIMHRRDIKNKKLSQEQLFNLLNTDQFNATCLPVPVIYPTEDCGSVCECPSKT